MAAFIDTDFISIIIITIVIIIIIIISSSSNNNNNGLINRFSVVARPVARNLPQKRVTKIEIEQGLTSHQTHYRSYRVGFLGVKWPNQQCQSTEERHKTKLNQIQQNSKIHLN